MEQLNTGKADYYYRKSREYFKKDKTKTAFEFLKKAIKFRNDIDTDIFMKYIELQGKTFFLFKQKNALLLKQFELVNNKLSETKKIFELQTQELLDKSTKILEQNTTIELLLDKT